MQRVTFIARPLISAAQGMGQFHRKNRNNRWWSRTGGLDYSWRTG